MQTKFNKSITAGFTNELPKKLELNNSPLKYVKICVFQLPSQATPEFKSEELLKLFYISKSYRTKSLINSNQYLEIRNKTKK